MKRYITALAALIIATAASGNLFAKTTQDTLTFQERQGVIITASRIPITNQLTATATSVVLGEILKTQPRGIGAEEALRLVPGVRVENQANGSRLHFSIRGQGILSERGIRGIKVLVDGIPMNDPSGFASDLYDVDWSLVNKIEVLRGPAASLYGGGGAGGALNITSEGYDPLGPNNLAQFTGGSNGFYKGLFKTAGGTSSLNYSASFSKFAGSGYRDHTGFYGDIFTEKLSAQVNPDLKVRQVFIYSDYFNQNAEGLSIDQLNEDPKQANPDAVPFNEYQKTGKMTNAVFANYRISASQDIDAHGFLRWGKYKETSNKAAQYRNFMAPGGGLQYNIRFGEGNAQTLAFGTDFQWQAIQENKFKSLSDPNRVDKIDDKNLEDTTMLANQTIDQNYAGVFAFYGGEVAGLNLMANLRYDAIHNELEDKLFSTNNLSGDANFDQLSVKLGLAKSFADEIALYANWGQGFMPPATEELASNPESFGGFNKNLEPASSQSAELGARGFFGNTFMYDVDAFYMTTQKDFFRFKLTPARGNQEVFYGNAGESRRIGVESYLAVKPFEGMTASLAYTYSKFTYTAPDSMKDNRLPNIPENMLSVDLEYNFLRSFTAGVTVESQSDWAIFTDPLRADIMQKGYTLVGARLQYEASLLGTNATFSVFGRNLTGEKYVAFTEPDPDGNSYQPGSGREFFGSISVRF